MTPVDTSDRIGILGWTYSDQGVGHFRIAEPLRAAAALGVQTFLSAELSAELLQFVDRVIVHTPHQQVYVDAIDALEASGSHAIIVDVDDAMWAPDWAPFKTTYTPDALARLYRNVARAHVVTTPSPVIAEHLARYNRNVHVLPNTVPAWVHQLPVTVDPEGPWIGYQGSPSHIRDFTPAAPHLARFLNTFTDWGVAFWGAELGPFERWPRHKHIGWTDIDPYYRSLGGLTVGIGPLRDTRFNRAKSSLRAVDYAARGVVAVLPDLAPYRGWVDDGVTGRLVHTHQTLGRVLHEVASDPEAIVKMSRAAHERAAGWTTEANIEHWMRAWDSL